MEARPDEVLTPSVQYWEEKGVVPQIVSDGHYRGWVNPDLMASLGIAGNAEDVRHCSCVCACGACGHKGAGAADT